ncbi:uncharacterized protein LOC123653380 [Melitaea cinxia]|uniref:uncharacterized protein LOC123653380 n=1 Tax=Melitaea cinxia TaxID=113334 RepID=UPI001E270382|nr:uncharacterized protein LOC123653380 [Melitaea cinxia]
MDLATGAGSAPLPGSVAVAGPGAPARCVRRCEVCALALVRRLRHVYEPVSRFRNETFDHLLSCPASASRGSSSSPTSKQTRYGITSSTRAGRDWLRGVPACPSSAIQLPCYAHRPKRVSFDRVSWCSNVRV